MRGFIITFALWGAILRRLFQKVYLLIVGYSAIRLLFKFRLQNLVLLLVFPCYGLNALLRVLDSFGVTVLKRCLRRGYSYTLQTSVHGHTLSNIALLIQIFVNPFQRCVIFVLNWQLLYFFAQIPCPEKLIQLLVG